MGTDLTRIQELATALRRVGPSQGAVCKARSNEIAELLDLLHRILSAALPEKVVEIGQRVELDERMVRRLQFTDRERRYREHAVVLLDSVRVLTMERAAVVQALKMPMGEDLADWAAQTAASEDNLRTVNVEAKLEQCRRQHERDEARAQLAQAQKEIERLQEHFKIACDERSLWRQRAMTFQDQRDQAKRSDEASQRDVGKWIKKYSKKREENQALAEGVRLYRMESPPFAQPVQIAKWEREHGALVPPASEPAAPDDFEQPTMNCPKCGREYPDFDGVGVAYCAPPDGCGFCRHLARTGKEIDGRLVMVCDFCGDPKQPREGGAEQGAVCQVCNDSHRSFNEERGTTRMCTSCPTPCQKCRQDGNGPYCETTPCPCDCHRAAAEILAAHRDAKPGNVPEKPEGA